MCLAGPCESLAAEPSSVMGNVYVDDNGHPQITECDTKRLISLGPKTSEAYVKFAQIYAEETKAWAGNVVVEVQGEISKSPGPNGELVVINPTVWRYRHGACESTPLTADDPVALSQLLRDLRSKLNHYRATPDSNLPFNDESDLKILIGVSREQIQAGLGAPEYCTLQPNCMRSEEWAYFFFYNEPLTFGGGCCALALYFNSNGRVTFVKWQAQR